MGCGDLSVLDLEHTRRDLRLEIGGDTRDPSYGSGLVELTAYVRHPLGTPIANLYLALLDNLGVHLDQFGDSTGRLNTLRA